MPCLIQLQPLRRPDFVAALDRLNAVYAAAMRPDPALLPGRREIMARHARYTDFQALAMVCAAAGPEPADTGPDRTGPGGSGSAAEQIIAFAYGFRGASGQWWHDVVRSGLTARAGRRLAGAWLDHSMEVAELHVLPEFQRRGLGRRLLLGLTDGRREQTAVLSTPDANWPARRLYGGVGFTDLLSDFYFPGGGPSYTVMGAVLPLRAVVQPARSPYDLPPYAGPPAPSAPAGDG